MSFFFGSHGFVIVEFSVLATTYGTREGVCIPTLVMLGVSLASRAVAVEYSDCVGHGTTPEIKVNVTREAQRSLHTQNRHEHNSGDKNAF